MDQLNHFKRPRHAGHTAPATACRMPAPRLAGMLPAAHTCSADAQLHQDRLICTTIHTARSCGQMLAQHVVVACTHVGECASVSAISPGDNHVLGRWTGALQVG